MLMLLVMVMTVSSRGVGRSGDREMDLSGSELSYCFALELKFCLFSSPFCQRSFSGAIKRRQRRAAAIMLQNRELNSTKSIVQKLIATF
ncbi:uncharacterized protein Dyak_GE27499 [Drosophila yakuba]|uniref:Uncharacterized protein n=1 Tax=Drosophila yakuba TaxID=7245 RepID=A0A0R1E643_DROYA|nr:uncharacterized protein Dyak_GE27499 [Drosophila yakuba]